MSRIGTDLQSMEEQQLLGPIVLGFVTGHVKGIVIRNEPEK